MYPHILHADLLYICTYVSYRIWIMGILVYKDFFSILITSLFGYYMYIRYILGVSGRHLPYYIDNKWMGLWMIIKTRTIWLQLIGIKEIGIFFRQQYYDHYVIVTKASKGWSRTKGYNMDWTTITDYYRAVRVRLQTKTFKWYTNIQTYV